MFDALGNVAGEGLTLELARESENGGTTGVILRRELDVEVGHGLKDSSARPSAAVLGRVHAYTPHGLNRV